MLIWLSILKILSLGSVRGETRKPFRGRPLPSAMRRASGLIVALDVKDAGTALRLAKECRDVADAVKIGWPLTLSAGPQMISRIAAEADVICDFKIADIPPISASITAAAFALGAKGVICHGFAGEDSVRACVEAAGPDQGAGPPRLGVEVQDLLGDRDPPLRRCLLPEAFCDEHLREGLQARGARRRVLRGRERLRQVRLDVVPMRRHLLHR